LRSAGLIEESSKAFQCSGANRSAVGEPQHFLYFLIRMKEATGRSKDIEDVQHLRWSEEMRRDDA